MNWVRMGKIGLCAMTLACVAARPANAGTVSLQDGTVRFAAAAGERNVVGITFHPDDGAGPSIELVDGGAPLAPGSGCSKTPEATVMCPDSDRGAGRRLELELGDQSDALGFDDCVGDRRPVVVRGSGGNDRIVVGACAGLEVTAYGGLHDDEIRTINNHSGTSRLYGGDGRDTLNVWEGGRAFLYGGPNHDTLRWTTYIDDSLPATESVQAFGDEGRDVFFPLESYRILEVVRGGPGRDMLMGGGLDPLALDLAECPECSLEGVTGTQYDDVIFGDDQANFIYGGAGNDTIDGRGGSDTIHAGDGDDTVTATDGVFDVIRCGAGLLDTVFADRRESLAECEIVNRATAGL